MMKSPKHARSASELRDRIVKAAGNMLVVDGFEHVSMRRVANEAGCSQMAMYRHFANKEALIQHLCAELYTQFVDHMNQEMAAESDPLEKLMRFVEQIIGFAKDYPDHYSLIFLTRYSDPLVIADRENLGREFIAGLRTIVKSALPEETSSRLIGERVRQMLATLHGTAALLIAHPGAYGLTKPKAISDAKTTLKRMLNTSDLALL
jgi:AcrR family transcriptional regulator